MRKIIFYLILICIASSFNSCTDYCPKSKKGTPVYYDSGVLADSVKAKIPYKNGGKVKFKHTKGHVISFSVDRFVSQQQTSCDWCCEDISYTKFQVDNTRLTPDYPLFDINLELNNLIGSNPEISIQIEYDTQIISNQFPVDTLLINKVEYLDIVKIPFHSSTAIDSAYFSKSKGLVKIIMLNKEYYELEN